jgi:prepilin-type N-terminal cleavage/methylation domain-containing protein
MSTAGQRRDGIRAQPAFTLIELMVTMTIISIVAGLALSGLAASRQRAKIDKTKSTIRKLHEIVMPQYESYLTRRVAANTPAARLAAVRLLMVQEMPDQWSDVYPSGSLTLPGNATAPTRRYAAFKSGSFTSAYEGAECLAMLITRGGFAPDATELFRNDEMGDIDNDGAPEFWDGWGRPIGFIRWPAGFSSILQIQDAAQNPDPFDPMKVSASVTYPSLPTPITQQDYGLVPLVYSPGPDESLNDPLAGSSGYGLSGGPTSWLQLSTLNTTRPGSPPNPAGTVIDVSAARDNITNHDLIKK